MEIDLKLLGPYAKLFPKDGIFKGAGASSVAAPANRLNFEATHKKRNVRFNQDHESARQGRRETAQEQRKKRRSDILTKKRDPKMAKLAENLNMLIHEDSSNEISAIEAESSVSSGGSTPEERKQVSQGPRNGLVKASGNPPSSSNGSKKGGSSDHLNNNRTRATPSSVNTGKPSRAAAPGPANPTAEDSRRERLEKYKREKEALANARRQQPAFRAGAAPAASSARLPKTTSGSTLARPAPASTSVNQPKVASQTAKSQPLPRGPQTNKPIAKSAESGRVVTRAMSKAQTGPAASALVNGRTATTGIGMNGKTATTGVNGRAATTGGINGKAATSAVNGRAVTTAGVKPAIQKMKNLNIAEKPSSSNLTGKSGGVTGSRPGITGSSKAVPSQSKTKPQGNIAATTSKQANKSAPSATKSKSKSPSPQPPLGKSQPTPQTNSTGENNQEQKAADEIPKVVPQKKLKPKAINAEYIDFNMRFSTACQKLKEYSCKWTEVSEDASAISEKIQGDILSALGNVKLLLEKKLPQFGELLYSYLCQQADPIPVLPCDLQGWWDVASIQLEEVDEKFKKLSTLKDNNWIEASPPPTENCSSQKEAKSLEKTNSQDAPRPPRVIKTSVKVPANSGLRAFLANKRKMLTKPESTADQSSESIAVSDKGDASTDNEKIAEELILPSAEKTFDGGFYKISSPKPTPDRLRKFERLSTSVNKSSINSSFAFPSPLRTPNRRNSQRLSTASEASLRRVSMCILGVRQSMGSLMKIGVTPGPSDDMNVSSASTQLVEAEDEMQVD